MLVKRRQACPQTLLHLWDAVAYIRQQRQLPNFDRLSVYMKRVYNLNSSDLERQLKFAVSDGLLILKRKEGVKGSKVGVEQDGYQVPPSVKERDGHDWYCFDCHRGGEVLLCSSCHRVFHELCIKDKDNEIKSDEIFICSVCKLNPDMFQITMTPSELNTLLSYTCIRLKEKTKELHRIPHPDDENWRFSFLVYEPMDLNAVEEKMKANEYTRLGDFFTDCQQIVHNVVVYFGLHSRISALSLQMIRDCEYDLQEIIQCSNCYKMSNTKQNSNWFCQPCDPPHELVYAKIRGFPYWPAKVIRRTEDGYDVRFFGALHQRALVDESTVRPITSNPLELGTKKTPSFDRAYRELCRHQELVKQASGQPSTPTPVEPPRPPRAPAPRKRKPGRRPTAVAPPAAKKDKKFYQESPTSSSPKDTLPQESPAAEDHSDANLVSSSSQETASVSHSSVSIQTEEEVAESVNISVSETQNQSNPACDCAQKYEKMIKDVKVKLKEAHLEDKNKALKELSDKIQTEMEAEKQKSVACALEEIHAQQRAAQDQFEEKCKNDYKEKIQAINEQQRMLISETKKKQWCYNCESEAIYHCCWNTSYCSVDCQQVHWHKEHKRTCRRKR